ncbi:hypothetical protein TNCV_5019171 [Trichonephila clavipes]|nr:hypothetical protein TNCV_5019171 [Trichonephila clavipes]
MLARMGQQRQNGSGRPRFTTEREDRAIVPVAVSVTDSSSSFIHLVDKGSAGKGIYLTSSSCSSNHDWPSPVAWRETLSSWKIPSPAGNKVYDWSSSKPLNDCSYLDRSTSILDSWKETQSRSYACAGVLQTCSRPVEKQNVKDDSSDYITFFHLSIDQILRM